jgi:hypothetical protein
MTFEELFKILNANIGKRLRITFSDGVAQTVEITSVDEEGFVHSGPDGVDRDAFWTRFEDVSVTEQENSN